LWQPPPADLRLATDAVHVWRASLDQPAERLDGFRATLADDELARAERLRFPEHRSRFVVAHGLLRAILARYLGAEPAEIRFRYGRWGKPFLLDERDPLRFNMTHSEDMVLFAVTTGCEVGIDVERINPHRAIDRLARRYFSEAENAAFAAVSEAMRGEAFFTCWTRKEAYIKAIGRGLSLPLHLFDVSLAPEEPPAILGSREDPEAPSRWRVLAVNPGPGYAAAVVVELGPCEVELWDFAAGD
jgi:4'-phosphopantetheinyl transferase